MKWILNFLFLSLVVLINSCTTVSNDRVRILNEQDMWVRRVIESGNFKINVNLAQPMQGAPVYLTSNYSLEIRKDSVFSYLPYFGVSHTAPLNMTGGGLMFSQKANMQSVISQGRKGVLLNFQVSTAEDTYKFGLQISLDGDANIDVLSNNRSMIWYKGKLQR